MSESDIVKEEQPNPDEVLAAIQSFSDPSIITNIFKELNWTYSIEIKETLALARQNANLSIKFKAIKHLRELLKEAAEASGYVARISQTVPNVQGGVTSFHARRIAGMLNPTKQIESTIKETQNDETKETRTESNRGSDRRQDETEGKDPSKYSDGSDSPSGTDTRRAFPLGDADPGGTEPPDGGETSRQADSGDSNRGGSNDPAGNSDSGIDSGDNPCIKTRKPSAGSGDLFPGISSAED